MQKQLIKTPIREIFTSIQGEGVWVGQKHIFVRFCKCNLKCAFCDTDFDTKKAQEYSSEELFNHLKNINCDVISLTGGEPLLDVEFLADFLKNYKEKLNKKIYLETNGTLYNELAKIIDFVDIISMDIKIKSATNQENQFEINDKFLNIASKKETFIKIVFDNNITNDEIINSCALANKYSLKLILQPKMPMDKNINLEEIYEKFYTNCKNIYLIPQVHKFLNLL